MANDKGRLVLVLQSKTIFKQSFWWTSKSEIKDHFKRIELNVYRERKMDGSNP